MLTPYDLHHGLAENRRDARAAVLLDAWTKHPERFPHGRPVPQALPAAVWINKPAAALVEPADQRVLHGAQAAGGAVNFVDAPSRTSRPKEVLTKFEHRPSRSR